MRPSLPPVPVSAALSAKELLSPRPQRPAGGAVDTRTTKVLERAASKALLESSGNNNVNEGSRNNHIDVDVNGDSWASNMNAGPSSSPPNCNPRVASWVAASGNQPGFAAYVNSARGSTPTLMGSAKSNLPGLPQHSASLPAFYPANGINAPVFPSSPQPQLNANSQLPPQRSSYAATPSLSQSQSQYQSSSQSYPHPRASPSSGGMIDPRQHKQQQPQVHLQPLRHSFSDMSIVNSSSPQSGQTGRASAYGRDPFAPLRNPSPAPSSSTPTLEPSSRRSSYVHSLSSEPKSIPPTSPTLCISLPSQAELSQQHEAIAYSPNPPAAHVSWSKAVLKFVERHQASSTNEFGKITDSVLVKWTDESIRTILSSAELSPPVPEALYLRGELSNSGKFPTYRSKDGSVAFRDFEAAANAGYYAAWAKIAFAYETFGEQNGSQADYERAKKAYEEGIRKNEVTCTYVCIYSPSF